MMSRSFFAMSLTESSCWLVPLLSDHSALLNCSRIATVSRTVCQWGASGSVGVHLTTQKVMYQLSIWKKVSEISFSMKVVRYGTFWPVQVQCLGEEAPFSHFVLRVGVCWRSPGLAQVPFSSWFLLTLCLQGPHIPLPACTWVSTDRAHISSGHWRSDLLGGVPKACSHPW